MPQMSPVVVSCLLFISVLVFHLEPAGCYANGKVTKSCGSMEPHHGSHGQTTPSKYRLDTNTTEFSPLDHINVVLSGNKTFFIGFLLEARDALNQSSGPVGTFTRTNLFHTQLLNCKHKQDAVSHTGNDAKLQIETTWNAPADSPKVIQFFATVLSHYDTYWVKMPGPIIHQPGFTPPPTTTTTPVETTTPSILPGPFKSNGCGKSKSCLLDPPGCDPEENLHCFFLSMTTEETNRKEVVFELSGPAEGYISFALSWDKWMGNDDVYMCVKKGDAISVTAASFSGRTYPEDQTETGLSSVSWRMADGVIQCKFSRPVGRIDQELARFTLDQEYFLFLADGNAQFGEIWKHTRQPLISTQKINIIGPPKVLEGSRGQILLLMHGSLMLVAWMLTGSIGTFIASFYKPEWPDRKLFGQKVWFQVHRGLMVLTVTLTIIAFCLPFVYRKGWSKHAGVHPYLGCCILFLSLLQPVMAAYRPSPDSNRRYIFNWAHWGVGSVTEVMAVAAMFLGVTQSTLPLPYPLTTNLLIGYLFWLAFLRALLLMNKNICLIKAQESEDTEAILPNHSEQCSWRPHIKSVILALLLLGNVILFLALLSVAVQI